MRRKSFSLVLLILIVVFVILAVVLSVHLINKPRSSKKDEQKNEKTNITNKTAYSSITDQLDNSFFSNLTEIESINSENTSSDNETTPSNTESEQEKIVSFGTHTYKFPNELNVTEESTANGKKELKFDYSDKNFIIYYSTIDSKNFNELKGLPNLSEYVESEYSVSVTSALKTGTVNNLDLIISTVSENDKNCYLLFTPISETETACAKIYNSENSSELIKDLADPLDKISLIISSIQ